MSKFYFFVFWGNFFGGCPQWSTSVKFTLDTTLVDPAWAICFFDLHWITSLSNFYYVKSFLVVKTIISYKMNTISFNIIYKYYLQFHLYKMMRKMYHMMLSHYLQIFRYKKQSTISLNKFMFIKS